MFVSGLTMQTTVLVVLTVVVVLQLLLNPVQQPMHLAKPAVLREYSGIMAHAHKVLKHGERVKLAVQRHMAVWSANESESKGALTQKRKLGAVDNSDAVKRNLRSGQQYRSEGTSKPQDVCIGSGFEASNEAFAVFAASFRQHNANARLVVFMDSPVDERKVEIARKFRAEVVTRNVDELHPLTVRSYHPNTYRWPLIDQYLEQHIPKHPLDRILLIDVHDSMFEGNPFAMVTDFGMFTSIENTIIGRSGAHSGWLRDCFGRHSLGKLWRHRIADVGATIGTSEAIREYVKQMADIVVGATTLGNFPRCERSGADTGVHNFLVHSGALTNLTIVHPGDDLILNMHAKDAWYQVQGRAFSHYNASAAIIYRYRASTELVERVTRQFKYWSDTPEEDKRCEGYSVHPNADGYFRRCDMKALRATSHFDCCDFCDAATDCTAWSYAAGACWLKNCKEPPKAMPVIPGTMFGYREFVGLVQ